MVLVSSSFRHFLLRLSFVRQVVVKPSPTLDGESGIGYATDTRAVTCYHYAVEVPPPTLLRQYPLPLRAGQLLNGTRTTFYQQAHYGNEALAVFHPCSWTVWPCVLYVPLRLSDHCAHMTNSHLLITLILLPRNIV